MLFPSREALCSANIFERFFESRKWTRQIEQKPEEDVVWQRFSQPAKTQSLECFRWIIQLRLTGCAGFFLQAPIPRRILTNVFEAIY